MKPFDPADLARWTEGEWLPPAAKTPPISGFAFDARKLRPGECFIALSGSTRDGHSFIDQAAERGASAALVERYQASPPNHPALPQLRVPDSLEAMAAVAKAVRNTFTSPVIGITGSCGKTSTREILRHLLGYKETHATVGNWNNRIGVPMTIFKIEPGFHRYAVIEAGINQPGEMAALGSIIQADVCIFTNIAAAHLELLESLENIAFEKSQLAHKARAGSPIFLTADTLRYQAFNELNTRAHLLLREGESFGGQVASTARYSLRDHSGGRTEISLQSSGTEHTFTLRSASTGICQNAALALLVALHLGQPPTLLRERLAKWAPATDRGHIAEVGNKNYYIDCYNANPASMADAINAFERVMAPELPRCYVLAAMNELGETALDWHRQLGSLLQLRPGDRAFFIGPPSLIVAYYQGARESGNPDAQLESSTEVESIKTKIADFQGALFLKGSRSYALEALLPPSLFKATHHA